MTEHNRQPTMIAVDGSDSQRHKPLRRFVRLLVIRRVAPKRRSEYTTSYLRSR